jgi:hypothetical protein
MLRKLIVITVIIVVLTIAGLPAITVALDWLGVIPLAQAIRAEYLTGTAITVIVSLIVLLPSVGCVWRRWPVTHCPVCDQQLRQRGRYCPACGSRVAA